MAHVELEEKIVANIFAMQKVIDPLDEMYRAAGGAVPGTAAGVRSLKSALEDLKKEAVIRSNRNKDLLSRRMAEIREEIKTLRTNPYRSGAAGRPAAPTLVDITG
jgi:hypothetical protein